MAQMVETIKKKDLQLQQKADSLNKAEQVIRKMNAEVENARRINDFNERQIKQLKEQFKNMQHAYSSQEKDL